MVPLAAMVIISMDAGRPHLFAASAAAFAAALLWGRLARLARGAGRRAGRPGIRVSDIRAGILVSLLGPVLSAPAVRRIQGYIEERAKPDILRAGTAENPRILGARSVLHLVISLAASVPAGLALAMLYHPALAALALAPAPLLISRTVSLRSRAADRKSSVEGELAPFAAMAGIMESVSVSLFSTFVMASESARGIFPAMGREGRRLSDVAALGMGPTDALLDLSGFHPSPAFRDFVDGYVSAYNTGGSDTAAYLQDQARRLFRAMRHAMAAHARRAEGAAQVMLVIMMLVPMMGLSMAFFATGTLAQSMMLVMIALLPPIAAVMIIAVQAGQPRGTEGIGLSRLALPAAAACAVSVYLARGQIWEAAGAGAVAGCLLNHLLIRGRLARSADVESALPEFMRQMTRLRNIGMDMIRSIGGMRADIVLRRDGRGQPKFNRTFDALIDDIYRKMAAGGSLEWAVSRARIGFWNARLAFLMLGKVHESGGGTAGTLEGITRWVTEYADAKREMVSNLRASLMTAFVGPVLMVMMAGISDRMAAEFERAGPGLGAAGAMSIAPDPLGLSEVLTVTAVVCMGVVLSKINYFSVRHTLFTGVITGVTMILLYAAPHFPSI